MKSYFPYEIPGKSYLFPSIITSTLRPGCHEAGQMAIRSTLDPPRPHAAGTPQRTDSGGAGPAAAAMGRATRGPRGNLEMVLEAWGKPMGKHRFSWILIDLSQFVWFFTSGKLTVCYRTSPFFMGKLTN